MIVLYYNLSIFNLRNFGANLAVRETTTSVKTPPIIIEGFSPNKRAVVPDSNAPISFDEPMKIPFTAETRPRISSGVASCKMVCLITTLTLSNAPVKNKQISAT